MVESGEIETEVESREGKETEAESREATRAERKQNDQSLRFGSQGCSRC